MASGAVKIVKKDSSGNVVLTQTGYSQVLLETTDLHLGHTNMQKYIDAVRLELSEVSEGTTIGVEIGHRDKLSEDVVYEDSQEIGAGNDMVYTRITAKYFRIRIALNTNTAYFVWAALEFFGAPAGRRFV